MNSWYKSPIDSLPKIPGHQLVPEACLSQQLSHEILGLLTRPKTAWEKLLTSPLDTLWTLVQTLPYIKYKLCEDCG